MITCVVESCFEHLALLIMNHTISMPTTSRAVGRCSRVGRLSVEEFVAIKRARKI